MQSKIVMTRERQSFLKIFLIFNQPQFLKICRQYTIFAKNIGNNPFSKAAFAL